MTPATMPPVVAFDLMDTLVHDPFREALRAATGRPLRELFARRDADAYPAFERGEIDEAAYWATFTRAGITVDPDRFHEVRRAHTVWLPGMRDLVRDIRAAGCRVVIASNYPYWLRDHEATLLAGLVDDVLGSYQLGVRKPEEAFFRAVVRRVDREPGDIVFVDDRQVNIDGAAAVGMRTAVAGPAVELREGLLALGLPLS